MTVITCYGQPRGKNMVTFLRPIGSVFSRWLVRFSFLKATVVFRIFFFSWSEVWLSYKNFNSTRSSDLEEFQGNKTLSEKEEEKRLTDSEIFFFLRRLREKKKSFPSHLAFAHTLGYVFQFILSPYPWISFICSSALWRMNLYHR